MMAAPGIGVHRQSSKASSRIELRPPKPQNEYLWVNFEGPNQRFKAKIGQTQSFIASKSHRLRKAKQLQNLRDSIQPLPTHRDELYPADRKEESNDSSESNGELTRSVVCRAVGIGVQAAFPIFSVSTNASLDFYFQYYRVHTSKMCFPLCSAHMMMLCTQTSKDLPVIILVLLASAASTRAVSFVPDSASAAEMRSRTVQDLLVLRAQIIKSLQGAVEEGPESDKEALILPIVFLCGLESAEGNTKAATAHVLGLKMIIAMLGGLESLKHTTISLVIFADMVAGLTSNFPLMFDIPPQWEKDVFIDSTLLAQNKHLSGHPVLGMAFFTSPWSHVIPPDLADIIQSLQQLIPYYEQNTKLQSHSLLIDNDYLVVVTRQLLAPSLKAHLNPFQEAIRISICLYSMTRIWSFPRKPCTLGLVRMLRESLDRCLGLLQTLAPDLLFWMFFMSCLASRGSREFAWAAHGLKECAETLSIFEWDGALPILEKFFFFMREDDVAKGLWHEVQYVRMNTAITGSEKFCQNIQDRH